MCGIFGFFAKPDAGFRAGTVADVLKTLALLSESRGRDSSGLVVWNEPDQAMSVLKGAVSISYLLKQKEVTLPLTLAAQRACSVSPGGDARAFAAMGHARLVTNGSQLVDVNNQPVVKDGVIGIHNGIIVNDATLFQRHPEVQRTYEIDTEVMLALVGKYVDAGWDLASSVSKTVLECVGTVSAAMCVTALDQFALVTNNGSLYVLTDDTDVMAFGSERYFLEQMRTSVPALDQGRRMRVRQVAPGTGYVIEIDPFRILPFTMQDPERKAAPNARRAAAFRIHEQSITDGKPQREVVLDTAQIAVQPRAPQEASLLEYNLDRIQTLRRCAHCLLPETFPFIEFDGEGVCNYCTNYQRRNQPKPIEELHELVAPYRSTDGSPDCIIPYSGGRDSTYTLHIAKNILKLNPVAFTYDWGMVTDLARRNIARVCGKLGVENIIVSADIRWKRENIRRNILAWLERPHLGMVPLFMAGDKFFFYYTDQVKKQTGIRLNIWGINPLENTDFKVGFMSVPPDFFKKRIYSLSGKNQMKLLAEVAGTIAANPRYLNRSVWDTLGSYLSRYIAPRRDYYHMFDYFRWDEAELDSLLASEYEWELSVDTKTTWRIGDGTAAFYNYIYYTVAGFSEYDTFRSNQIREGVLSREAADRLATLENRPRYATIKWYTEIVGLDYASTIRRINSIPKLYC